MTQATFDQLPARSQAALQRAANAVAGVKPVESNSWEIKVADLLENKESAAVLKIVQEWVGGNAKCLYFFECVNPQLDCEAVAEAFAIYKAREVKGRACPRLNEPSKVFYVGSSQSMRTRFAEHLGYGSARTYALQLRHWAAPFDLNLRFDCAKYELDVPYSTVQLLEDELWTWKQPMFGRLGRK